MYDFFILLSFVAIVLSPCVVARCTRTERNEKARPRPQPSAQKLRPRSRPLVAARSLPLRGSVRLQAAHAPRPIETLARKNRPQTGAIFIAPRRRHVTPTPVEGAAKRGFSAVVRKNQPIAGALCIAPVRRMA